MSRFPPHLLAPKFEPYLDPRDTQVGCGCEVCGAAYVATDQLVGGRWGGRASSAVPGCSCAPSQPNDPHRVIGDSMGQSLLRRRIEHDVDDLIDAGIGPALPDRLEWQLLVVTQGSRGFFATGYGSCRSRGDLDWGEVLRDDLRWLLQEPSARPFPLESRRAMVDSLECRVELLLRDAMQDAELQLVDFFLFLHEEVDERLYFMVLSALQPRMRIKEGAFQWMCAELLDVAAVDAEFARSTLLRLG